MVPSYQQSSVRQKKFVITGLYLHTGRRAKLKLVKHRLGEVPISETVTFAAQRFQQTDHKSPIRFEAITSH